MCIYMFRMDAQPASRCATGYPVAQPAIFLLVPFFGTSVKMAASERLFQEYAHCKRQCERQKNVSPCF